MEPWNDADRSLGSKCKFKPAEQMNYDHMLGPVSYEHNTKKNVPHTEPKFFVNLTSLGKGALFRSTQPTQC